MGQLCSTGEKPVPMARANAPQQRPPLPHIASSPPPGKRGFPSNEHSTPKASEMTSPRGSDSVASNAIDIGLNGDMDGDGKLAGGLASPISPAAVLKLEPSTPLTASSEPKPNPSLSTPTGVTNIPTIVAGDLPADPLPLTTQPTLSTEDTADAASLEGSLMSEADRFQLLRLMSVFRQYRAYVNAETQRLAEEKRLSDVDAAIVAAKNKADSEARVARKSDKDRKALEKKRRAEHEAEVLRAKWEADDKAFAEACANEAKQIAPLDPSVTFVKQWGSKGTANGQFRIPIDIAVGPSSGDLYILDKLNNRVQVFSRDGDFKRSFGSDLLVEPFGLAFLPTSDSKVSGDSQLVISEDTAHRLSIWDGSTGTRIRVIGSEGNGAGQFNRPCGIATVGSSPTEPNGLIFVADFMNNRIAVVRPDGTHVRHLASNKLDWPQGVAISPDARLVLVSETGSSRIVGLNANDGRIVATLAGPSPPTELGQGSGGKLRRPSRLIVGYDGLVYAADTGHHRIQVFRADGKLMSSFGNPYSGSFNDYSRRWQRPADLRFPSALVLNPFDGIITVCDTSNNRIQQFKLSLAALSSSPASPQATTAFPPSSPPPPLSPTNADSIAALTRSPTTPTDNTDPNAFSPRAVLDVV